VPPIPLHTLLTTTVLYDKDTFSGDDDYIVKTYVNFLLAVFSLVFVVSAVNIGILLDKISADILGARNFFFLIRGGSGIVGFVGRLCVAPPL
jgi:hypothetical protein